MRAVAISALVAGLIASPFALADKATRHLTTDQALSCVKGTSAAQSGSMITKIEVDVDHGKTICEVHFEDAKGKNSQAHFDVAANKVVKIK